MTGIHPEFDLAIAGGGLAATITAAIIRQNCPDLSLVIIDKGGHRPIHTWSFHAKDLSAGALKLLQPLISKSWNSYTVRFPDKIRRLSLQYCSIRSENYWQQIDSFLSGVTKISGDIESIGRHSVVLNDGTSINAAAVLDARGITADTRLPVSGWQKFIGFEIETEEPHGISEPVIMDATIEQQDGFRFFYLLPFSTTRILIEDTYYSDDPVLHSGKIEAAITGYIKSLGIAHFTICARESGVLPIPLDDAYLFREPEVPAIGMRGGFFHPTSGYSLPYVVKCAERLAVGLKTYQSDYSELDAVVQEIITTCRREYISSSTFLIRLNRMLFRAAEPTLRWKILSQFYCRKLSVISSFYSGSLSLTTKLAMICGIPPVPLFRGLRHFLVPGIDTPDVRRAISG